MPKHHTVHPVAHRAQNMFDLVADIERYPEFVPLCQNLKLRTRREKAGREILVADLTVGYKAIRETLTCQVVLNREDLSISVSYVDGPFKYLNNDWRFEPSKGSGIAHEEHCNVVFDLDYEFKSRALAMVMGAMFDQAFSRFVKAFEQRADMLYGMDAA
ncbi:MAG: type II toxin-antitoxin system RatA family toxin [Pseudomonadota bacterium]